MAYNSDHNKLKRELLETEELKNIEFSEHWGNDRNDTDSQYGGARKNKNTVKRTVRTEREIDSSDDDESKDEDIDYLFTSEVKQSGGNKSNTDIEKDIYTIFNNAKQYGTRLENIAQGGANKKVDMIISDSESPKKMKGGDYSLNDNFTDEYDNIGHEQLGGANERFASAQEIARKLKDNPKVQQANLKHTQIISLAWLILKDTNSVKEALVQAENPAKYIEKFKSMPKKEKKPKKPKKEKKAKMQGGYY